MPRGVLVVWFLFVLNGCHHDRVNRTKEQERVPLIVVNVARASSPLATADRGELAGDVAGEAGVHGDVELPAVA